MAKTLSILSFALSVVAVTISVVIYSRADAIADEAVRRREQQIVDQLRPDVHAIYSDFDLELPPSAVDPKSLGDLFAPMFRLVQSVQEDGG
jgi:hypothetical protein